MTYSNTCVYTINGFMGDCWAGPQADTGRYLSDQGTRLAYWQPVAYNAGAFPLGIGAASGLAELQNLFTQHAAEGRTNILMSSWSLGSIVAVEALQHSMRGDVGWPPLSAWKGATTFGNPYREAGSYAPKTGPGAVSDPGGAGIGGPANNLKGTPSWWHDYAHPGDLYAVCPTGPVGDDIRIIFDFVLEKWSGAFSDLWLEAQELVNGPLKAAPSVLMAVIQAIAFYGGGTAQHVNYQPNASMNYLAGIARTL